jgi:hypothetical protein
MASAGRSFPFLEAVRDLAPQATQGIRLPPQLPYVLLGDPGAPPILVPRAGSTFEQLPVEWKPTPTEGLRPFFTETQEPLTWAPCGPGQMAFLTASPLEVAAVGNRGAGKSEYLLVDFARHGPSARGLLFRRTFPELSDIVHKAKALFFKAFPKSCTFNQADYVFRWASGAELKLAYLEGPDDYLRSHGKQFTWIGADEATLLKDLRGYLQMMSLLRSTNPAIKLAMRATCNPSGPSHNAVKRRFNLPLPAGLIAGPIIDGQRQAIRISFQENAPLRHADPNYLQRVAGAAISEAQRAAWVEERWDVTSGGMYDDIWDATHHVLPDFPYQLLRTTGRIDRALDFGGAAPSAVGFWWESIGEPLQLPDGRRIGHRKGDLILFDEIYTCTAADLGEGTRITARELAQLIHAKIDEMGLRGHVRPGPADEAIRAEADPRHSPEGEMRQAGIQWILTPKGPGSVLAGHLAVRQRLKNAITGDGPGLWVCQRCRAWLETVPCLPRDPRNPDVHTGIDHASDMTRYRVFQKNRIARFGSF